jgi:SAM-dependent methyltransferase
VTELARSFERAAGAYERGRPEYAEAALDALALPPDAVVLDLAAGTGKLTRQLVLRCSRVIAVEPLDAMREVLERLVPQADALEGTATEIPLVDASVDAVFVAEALHWFATEEVLREIARVLRPRGVLAILFNQLDGEPDPPPPPGFRDLIDALAIRKPPEQTVKSGLWRTPFPGPFEPLTELSFPNPVERDREGRLAQIASWSIVAALPDPDRERLLGQLAELLPEGRYQEPLRTDLSWTRLR